MNRAAPWLRCFCVLGFLVAFCAAQASRPTTRPKNDAEKLLDAFSDRLYSPLAAGLRELEYNYLASPEGALTGKFRVNVLCRAESRPSVELMSEDRTRLKELPSWLNAPAPGRKGTTVKDLFESGGRATAKWFLPEIPNRHYATWNKRLETRTVNGREERILVLEPSAAHPLRRIEMTLDPRGLPFRVSYFPAAVGEGVDTIVEEPVYELIDGKLVRSSWKESSGQSSVQHVLNYQSVRGYLVPASHERMAPGSKQVDRTVFDRVTVSPPLN